ncbi:acyltransferase [Granulicella mallensis]|uniref:Peptidoglycan/LPS O-acetylase OafA/YrhL n=1 Tax=Granulicella mallensis TaxID=940614 RepID=A0A7W7ZNR0_9BACT|nr:acyltransferase [Granulicella mallensis]MBB5062954.1 peptidoglycan/LPS O-acetylase OafA/YrhL [Granulicella mallensis]
MMQEVTAPIIEKMRDLPNLDFVRSIAVISVVAEHTLLALGIQQVGPFPVAYAGVLGVFVFFVLTALVLMWSLERKPHTLDFYIRRWFRIYPLAIAAILAAVVSHAPVAGTPTQFFLYTHPGGITGLLVQMALLQNVIHAPSVLSVLWTLPYEVQMYLLLPPLYFFVRRNFSLWPLLLIWGLVLLQCRYVPADQNNFAVAIGYFLPGIMSYVAFGRWKPRAPGWLLPFFLLTIWLLFLYHCNFHKGWYFCLVIALALPLFKQMKSEIVLAPSRIIARYSYGIYITHPFAIVIGLYLLRGCSLPVRLLGEVVPLVVLPFIAYHVIEHPMMRLGSRLAARAEKRYEQREKDRSREVLNF